ncbi:MAG: histidine kinase, partial [Sphingobacteriaceae bacterium]
VDELQKQQTYQILEERNQLLETQNHKLSQEVDELEHRTQHTTTFIANLSHELRTPLNSILLLSRHLSENDEANLSNEQIESAEVILSSGKGLLKLIDGILDLSRIEAGQMELEYEEVTIDEVVSELQSLFAPVAKEKKLTLNIITSTLLPKTIETDVTKLGQILKNLLANAFKFTAQGTISLKVEPQSNDSYLNFEVTDTGIGISKADQELIFEPFKQAEISTRKNFGGTGLGLSISRKLAELLHGTIRVESESGKGSRFTLAIPIKKPEAISFEKPAD